ncbi:MAG: tetratricopeptide repeat protein [Candidatus Cloacimonas sp.]|nr:tetratricopeptide repeat protein [Candidatus Cloacimonadota bacterium]
MNISKLHQGITLQAVICLTLLLLTACSQLAKLPKYSYEELIAFGDQSFANGEYLKSVEFYDTATKLNPQNPLSYYKKGLVYGALHSFDLEKSSIKSKPSRIGRSLQSEDSYFEKARKEFKTAAELGHHPSKEILRALYDNIQHKDVKY